MSDTLTTPPANATGTLRGWQLMDKAPTEENSCVLACIEGEASDCYVSFWGGEWRDANDTPVKPLCWRHYDRSEFA